MVIEKLNPGGDITTVMSNALTAGITSLASGSNVVGAVMTPPANAGEADWELLFTPTASIAAGVTVPLWLLPTLDGTNYADGGSADPQAAHLVGVFVCATGAGQQRLIIRGIPWPAWPCKAVISNDTGQAFSAALTHTLRYRNVRRVQTPVF